MSYSAQSKVQMVIPDELVEGKTAPAVTGNLSNEQALSLLLRGSGLSGEFTAPRTVRLSASRRESMKSQLPAIVADSGRTRPLSIPQSSTVTDEIVVTGTRIRGVAPVGSELISINREQIAREGHATTADVIRSLPANVTLGANEDHVVGVQAAVNNTTNFGSSANLRGLGPDATLTLLNGHRVAPSGLGSFVDISSIPLSAIERVDVVADGASAIYGADAVGGVVNFILRRDYAGEELTARYGVGDGFRQTTVGATVGTNWQGGALLVGYEYYYRTHLSASSRRYFTEDLRAFGGADYRSTLSTPGNIVVNGVSYAIPAGQNGRTLTPSQLIPNTTNRQDEFRGTDILPSQQRHSAIASVSQDVSDSLRFFADALYTHRNATLHYLAQTTTLTVPNTNPFFVSPVAGARSISVGYSFLDDLGPSAYRDNINDVSITGGATYSFADSWKANFAVTYTADESRSATTGFVNFALLPAALAGPANAFNPFGSGSNNSQSVLDSITGWGSSYVRYRERIASLDVGGDLFSLPGGSVKIVVGAEYRTESYKTESINYITTATPTLNSLASRRRRIVSEFGEILVPVFGKPNAVLGIESLVVSVAGRHERYSDFGGTSNPKVGLNWAPSADLSLRGSWGTSFKAPLFSQLVESTSPFATGRRADPKSPSGISNIIQIGGGNPSLKPETATTWSVGADFHPSFVPDLVISGTYFSIDYRDRVLPLSSGELGIVLVREDTYAPYVTRNPSAATVNAIYADPRFNPLATKFPPATVAAIIDARPRNVGSVTQRGLDVSLAYTINFGQDIIQLTGSFTKLFEYKVGRVPSSAAQDQLNVIGNPNDFRLRAGAVWQRGAFRAGLFGNYINGYDNITTGVVLKVPSWLTADATFAFLGSREERIYGLDIALNIQNLFDRSPPFVDNAVTKFGFDPESANALGRVVSLSLTKRF